MSKLIHFAVTSYRLKTDNFIESEANPAYSNFSGDTTHISLWYFDNAGVSCDGDKGPLKWPISRLPCHSTIEEAVVANAEGGSGCLSMKDGNGENSLEKHQCSPATEPPTSSHRNRSPITSNKRGTRTLAKIALNLFWSILILGPKIRGKLDYANGGL
jgi:hypothetical protein